MRYKSRLIVLKSTHSCAPCFFSILVSLSIPKSQLAILSYITQIWNSSCLPLEPKAFNNSAAISFIPSVFPFLSSFNAASNSLRCNDGPCKSVCTLSSRRHTSALHKSSAFVSIGRATECHKILVRRLHIIARIMYSLCSNICKHHQ